MKSLKITVLIAISMVFACAAVAMHHAPEDRGKALFNDTKLGGGTAGKSCGTCHPDGKGLEGISGKTEWMGKKSLEEAVNMCITNPLKGAALDVKSEEMKDLVTYMKSIKPKEEKATRKKKPVVGC